MEIGDWWLGGSIFERKHRKAPTMLFASFKLLAKVEMLWAFVYLYFLIITSPIKASEHSLLLLPICVPVVYLNMFSIIFASNPFIGRDQHLNCPFSTHIIPGTTINFKISSKMKLNCIPPRRRLLGHFKNVWSRFEGHFELVILLDTVCWWWPLQCYWMHQTLPEINFWWFA